MKTALLVLEDGSQFYGKSIGANGESVGEIVFNTSMTGYQEIITDPSYAHQIVVLTYPHIGNIGTNDFDNESDHIQVSGIVIRNLTIISSNFRYNRSLSNFLRCQNIVGISDVDTRRLTRLIREKGTQRACIMANSELDAKLALCKACTFLGSNKLKLAYSVSTSQQYIWNQGTDRYDGKYSSDEIIPKKFFYRVVVYDFGIKYNIMRILVDYGCLLIVVPANTVAQEVVNLKPDGILLSNGPGDPNEYQDVIHVIRFFLSKTNIPMLGICLGHQLLALASGAKIIKMKFGHHGSNHPVKNVETNKVMITSQNHNFVVDIETLPNTMKVTHISLFDGTLQGIRYLDRSVISFQGHPEASPGPHDSVSIFNDFIQLIKKYRNKK
ncbi:carbamoyl-phosphate synthase small chain [Candidatus Blochmanniella floridana]|uniref:Carbamoyl phosphate synthase small chain n=1 Tax=Blochmanniella floridana TaxID=203907 RepID=Q7VQK7_BLOFL|nr:carbamoyl-phosphate synthase small chain [Candidatus Blochmannia floridanus]